MNSPAACSLGLPAPSAADVVAEVEEVQIRLVAHPDIADQLALDLAHPSSSLPSFSAASRHFT
jgi:hypothetical protein